MNVVKLMSTTATFPHRMIGMIKGAMVGFNVAILQQALCIPPNANHDMPVAPALPLFAWKLASLIGMCMFPCAH